MELLALLIDFILHIDRYIESFVQQYGVWVYGLLFLIVFVETGLVIMPFLPGDSLMFVAAILGDQCNYLIGRRVGERVYGWETSRWFNRQAFDKAHAFYERYGGITIVLARFMPFIRTFAPFVAGVADMHRGRFTFFNVTGAVLWVVGVGLAGYWFGNIPWVKVHLEKIIWGLILVPGCLALFGAWRAGRSGPEKASG